MKTALSAAGGEKDIAVYLIANEKAVPFYEKLGMKKADDVMQYNHIDWTEFTVGDTVQNDHTDAAGAERINDLSREDRI